MKLFITGCLFVFFIFGTLVSAEARHRSYHKHYTHNNSASHYKYRHHKRYKRQQPVSYQASTTTITDDRYPQRYDFSAKRYTGEFPAAERTSERHAATRGEVIGGRPSGCPSRFCGCALSLHLFGRIVPGLNLAANWLRFPGTAPSPGMVAARHGHVFKLVAHVGGSTWKVWDANSGGGRIRVHNRSIAGFRIVNPSRG